jgi:hypothetical protein
MPNTGRFFVSSRSLQPGRAWVFAGMTLRLNGGPEASSHILCSVIAKALTRGRRGHRVSFDPASIRKVFQVRLKDSLIGISHGAKQCTGIADASTTQESFSQFPYATVKSRDFVIGRGCFHLARPTREFSGARVGDTMPELCGLERTYAARVRGLSGSVTMLVVPGMGELWSPSVASLRLRPLRGRC